jgi:hypothetical protein
MTKILIYNFTDKPMVLYLQDNVEDCKKHFLLLINNPDAVSMDMRVGETIYIVPRYYLLQSLIVIQEETEK